ncbi:unnamed protein product, partial [Phaeothamnion confervicola]
GRKLKAPLQNCKRRMFVTDFFGRASPLPGLGVPLPRYLTAFPVIKENSFLGYSIPPRQITSAKEAKAQGVIWGKEVKHMKMAAAVIMAVADVAIVHLTVKMEVVSHPNIVYRGMLTGDEWHALLAESRFLVGLGDPLAGPSAVDAVAAGCVYVNPVYAKQAGGRGIVGGYSSQHPYLADAFGPPRVCSYREKDAAGAASCVRQALSTELEPFVPPDFTEKAYMARVRRIFADYL